MPALNEWICKLHPSGSVAAKTLFVAASVVAVYKLGGHVLREYIIIPQTTILKDIDTLHTARRDGKIPGRALICGGSIAGLLAAAVCADHFESVMIIEAEAWANEHGTELPRTEERAYRTTPGGYPTVTAPRARIIQYYFGNLFQPTVYSAFIRLFPCVPGIIDELNIGSTVGVPKMKLAYGDANLEEPYTDDDIKAGAPISPCLTREATEIVLRKAVKKTHSNVVFKTGTVHGLLREGDSLTGVTIRADGAKADIKANFVVDATGPNQMSYTKWFQNAGVPTPPDLRVEYDPILRYTVSIWTIPAHLHSKWPIPGGFQCGVLSLKNCDIEAGESRILAFVVAENNQLLVNFGGPCLSDLPHSLPELREYTQNIYGDRTPPDWVSPLLDFMEEYEEECKPFWVDIRVPPMSWVQWHKIAKNGTLPRNWIAVGDANMNLNPLYGQGIFKSCVDVTTLDTVLRSIPASSRTELPNIPQLFYKRQNPRVSSLWDSSRANDYGWPTTIPVAGEDLSCNSWIRKYGRSCIMLAREDPYVLTVWWHVAMQLAPGTDLFTPWIALKVARYQLLGW